MSTPSRHRMSEQAAETAVVGACRRLRLPTIRSKFPDLEKKAQPLCLIGDSGTGKSHCETRRWQLAVVAGR